MKKSIVRVLRCLTAAIFQAWKF